MIASLDSLRIPCYNKNERVPDKMFQKQIRI